MNFRTDRNNNPAAITTDIARQAGLREGIDFVNGDPFQDGDRTYYTAKLLTKDPFGMIVQVINNVGYYTKSGSLRWNYIGIPKILWDSFSDQQKLTAVHYHYLREGGEALKNVS